MTLFFAVSLVSGCASAPKAPEAPKEEYVATKTFKVPAQVQCDKVLPPDSVGKDAFVPNLDHISEGMLKEDAIRIFCREPDHKLEDGDVLGWAFDLTTPKKVFDVQLKFDKEGKYLGHTDEGLRVVVHSNEE